MIFFLTLGIVLGIISVVFALQNTEVVTVSFLTWQFEGSLALVLLLTIMSGILMTLLILFPSLIKEAFSLASLKRQKKALEAELTTAKQAEPSPPTPVQDTNDVKT
ncbi:MAG: LapA family protein [Candidatus Adlerbacteria bacterium]|nr:LapA family protein [Candidatus Adlerbacteria bacterium]